ncbi:MAG: hypothetical protein JW934_14635 [Anaerolineae bacterium]|nr:hypothetical protein [Anaerolineae bacterium]
MSGQARASGIWSLLKGKPLDERQTARRKSKLRLLALLIFFDVLLIAAVLLSFQEKEYIDQVERLEQTREVIVTVMVEQTITSTRVVTEIVPYGSVE